MLLLGFHQLSDEVPILVKEKGNIVVCVHLDAFTHLEVVVDHKVEAALELLLIDLGLFSDECLVLEISYVIPFYQVRIHHKLMRHCLLQFL